jgi:hypothetical protein
MEKKQKAKEYSKKEEIYKLYSSTTKYYYNDIQLNLTIKKNNPKFIIRVGDMFEIAKEFKKPVIHNFANNEYQGGPLASFTPDGNFISISDNGTTQEDQLIKRYRDKIILPKKYYSIIANDNIALLYSYCQELPPIITLPSIIKPNFKKKKIIDSMLKRLELLMYICCQNDNTLITGLWGCGAFGMEPQELANLWKHAFINFNNKPVDIVFVIYQDEYTKKYDNITDLFSGISSNNY